MSQLQQFQFGLMDLRVLDLDGQPWFVAKDVFDVLGYPKGSRTYQLLQLAADEVQVLKIQTLRYGTKALKESGLYKLIMRSDKPDARAFQDWVTRVVLPAIRKDGAYIKGEEKVATGEMSDDELFLKALQVAQRKVDRYKAERDQLELDKQLLLPAAQVGQAVASANASVWSSSPASWKASTPCRYRKTSWSCSTCSSAMATGPSTASTRASCSTR